MIVGVCTLQLELPAAHSLKDKRRIIQSLIGRIRNEFNVSVAEVDHQELWQSATLGMACVCNDPSYAHGLLTRAVQWVEQSRLDVVLADFQIEIT